MDPTNKDDPVEDMYGDPQETYNYHVKEMFTSHGAGWMQESERLQLIDELEPIEPAEDELALIADPHGFSRDQDGMLEYVEDDRPSGKRPEGERLLLKRHRGGHSMLTIAACKVCATVSTEHIATSLTTLLQIGRIRTFCS